MSLRLHTHAAFRQRKPVLVPERCLGIKIYPVFSQNTVKPYFFVIRAHQLQDWKQRMAPKLSKAASIFHIGHLPQIVGGQSGKACLHIPNLSDCPASCNPDELCKPRAICRLDRLKQSASVPSRQLEQFLCLRFLKCHRLFTQHMFLMHKRCFCIFVMGLMRRRYIYRIHTFKKSLHIIPSYIQLEFFSEFFCAFYMGIKYAIDNHSTDILCLRHKPLCYSPSSNYPDSDNRVLFRAQHGGRYIFGPLQIHYFTVIL
ncbi:hypothetical protein IMSAG025_01921 [Muribaculaceae bacterium]|nr:hypothetical protein IMSAG025_01921 [Muribaculaceae bacterium]